MDLRLHLSIIWRYRLLVVLGLILALVLTFLSVFRVDPANGFHVSYRQSVTWQSSETLLLHPKLCNPIATSCGPNDNSSISSTFYAQLANSEVVRTRVRATGALKKATDYLASPISDPNNPALPTPFLEIDGLGTSIPAAMQVARAASSSFAAYLDASQKTTPPARQVAVQVVSPPTFADTKVVHGRKLTLAVLVFLVLMIATIGLAYILNNLFPEPALTGEEEQQPEETTKRKLETLDTNVESLLPPIEPLPKPVEQTMPRKAAAASEQTPSRS